MNIDSPLRRHTVLTTFLCLCICLSTLLSACQPSAHSEASDGAIESKLEGSSRLYFRIDEDGKLSRPEGYRNWVYVGTPLTPNDLNPPESPFPEFHNVYIDPVSWAHYEETGKFRDGTMLVKELVSVGSKAAVSGAGYFMGDFLGLEAAIKSQEHFPSEPGHWAYFSFGHSYPLAESAEAFPSATCNTCHATSAADDFVFTQYYPVLRAANDVPGKGPALMADSERKDLMDAMNDATVAIGEPRVATGTSVGPVPTNLDALFEYLVARRYEAFSQRESAAHPSRGPHVKFGRPVRVFINDTLAESMAAKGTSHPAGSSIVKEMYLDDGTTLEGWAVMVKTQDDSANGDGWFWYEVTSTTDPAQLGGGQAGNGIPLCTGCHTTGNDYVVTEYPLQ